jgi:hypothetical protein
MECFTSKEDSTLLSALLELHSNIVESTWWFLHRTTGFSVNVEHHSSLLSSFISTSIFPFKPTSPATNLSNNLFHKLKSLSTVLKIPLPDDKVFHTVDGQENDDSENYAVSALLITAIEIFAKVVVF